MRKSDELAAGKGALRLELPYFLVMNSRFLDAI